ncbi:MAG TPA: CNP1-like family protein [Burkholderiales bacterium]|nr:CNP1-like family protein [Burkholderiales bacterium]
MTLSVIAVALWGCGGSSAPRVKAPQRGMPEDIGGVPEKKEFKEIEVVLPPYPDESRLLEFQLRRNSTNRYYVERDSVSIGSDRVVRFSAVIKSASGALNTSYEGMRCKTSEYKVYAYGINNNEWEKAHDSQWRRIERSSIDFRFTLYKDYFCDVAAIAGRNEKDLIANLKGNPLNNITDKNR